MTSSANAPQPAPLAIDAGAPDQAPDQAAAGGLPPRPAAFQPLDRLFLAMITTRGRIIALGLLALVGVVVGAAVRGEPDHMAVWVRFANTFGLSLIAPVVALVFASATLGNLSEDGTLVYLWLRPVRRGQIALTAYAAAITVVAPLVIVPLALGAVAANAGGSALWATVTAGAVGVVAYSGLFTWLGLRVRRPLAWGLAYILIWEGVVAGVSTTASRLAIRAYTRSILSRATGVPLRLSSTSLLFAYLVPAAVAAVMVWATARRLGRTDVA
jgi:ABC-2 type transport system permease protein